MKPRTVPAGKFKAECLRIMDEVAAGGRPVVITKRGKPVARLVPAASAATDVMGVLEGKVEIRGDIVKPALTPKQWGELWS